MTQRTLPPKLRVRCTDAATLAVVVTLLTCLSVGMWYGYPSWDDGWLALYAKENGANTISTVIPDRPVFGKMLELFLYLGQGPTVVFALILWLALGLISAKLFTIFFPYLSAYKPLSIALAVSPVLVKAHFVFFNVTLSSVLPVVLGYFGTLLLYRYATDSNGSSYLILGAATLAAGTLISEYAIPCALIGIVILIHRAGTGARKRCYLAVAVASISVGLPYIFLAANARENTSPDTAIQNLGTAIGNLPILLAGTVWQSIMGSHISAISRLSEVSLENRPALISLALIFILAPLSICACRRIRFSQVWRSHRFIHLCLPMLALTVGILPVLLMNRTTFEDTATRFLIPVIPLSSAVFLFLITWPIRKTWWFLPPLIVAIVCGTATSIGTTGVIRQRRLVGKYAVTLRERVESNDSATFYAVIPSNRTDYELTGAITMDWPVELEKRFWANGRDSVERWLNRSTCVRPAIKRDLRGVKRDFDASETLTINGLGEIEDYCLRDQTLK